MPDIRTKISELSELPELTGDEWVPVVIEDGGNVNRKVTTGQIAGLGGGDGGSLELCDINQAYESIDGLTISTWSQPSSSFHLQHSGPAPTYDSATGILSVTLTQVQSFGATLTTAGVPQSFRMVVLEGMGAGFTSSVTIDGSAAPVDVPRFLNNRTTFSFSVQPFIAQTVRIRIEKISNATPVCFSDVEKISFYNNLSVASDGVGGLDLRYNPTAHTTTESIVVTSGFGNRAVAQIKPGADFTFTDRVDMAISPRTNGSLVSRIVNYRGTPLNARGNGAVDWQQYHEAADQVAQGMGSTISGGGENAATATYSTVGGGQLNRAQSQYSTVPGGEQNTIQGGAWSTIGGGDQNKIEFSQFSTIAGGRENDLLMNPASGSGYENTIGGGDRNRILLDYGDHHTIAGGSSNNIGTPAKDLFFNNATISGGSNNIVLCAAGTIPGGTSGRSGRRWSGAYTYGNGDGHQIRELLLNRRIGQSSPNPNLTTHQYIELRGHGCYVIEGYIVARRQSGSPQVRKVWKVFLVANRTNAAGSLTLDVKDINAVYEQGAGTNLLLLDFEAITTTDQPGPQDSIRVVTDITTTTTTFATEVFWGGCLRSIEGGQLQ